MSKVIKDTYILNCENYNAGQDQMIRYRLNDKGSIESKEYDF